MTKPIKTSYTTLSRFLFWAAAIALVVSFSIFVLEKSRVTNFYVKPDNSANVIEGVKPANTVDLSPTTDTEAQDGERIKSEAAEQQTSQTTSNNTKLDVSLSAAGQDVKGGAIIVRAIIGGTNGGKCKLVLTNTSMTKEYTADVENLGTYYGCKGFDVSVNDISAGKYTATLTVTNGNASGSISQTIEVSK